MFCIYYPILSRIQRNRHIHSQQMRDCLAILKTGRSKSLTLKRIFRSLSYPNASLLDTVVLKFRLTLQALGELGKNIKVNTLFIFSKPEPHWCYTDQSMKSTALDLHPDNPLLLLHTLA